MFFNNKYSIFTLSFEKIKWGKFQPKNDKKMQRNVTYLFSVSPIIRGLREFGMIFAERERERERENYKRIYNIYYAGARNLKNFLHNLYIAGLFFRQTECTEQRWDEILVQPLFRFIYSFRFIPTNFFTGCANPKLFVVVHGLNVCIQK
ncbi:MAG: hypothetical protein EZS26_003062 [Candidatus Ordinivivax streblomastigis]|uniref:Uncharacterized protein n=1 Tax=Candidatus Ordinivivax streblomastigis TaxID=2540710 RepID=A0A5M8NVT2_9BACT|nr:MAG: hypothetical protein EZS26_003062 [Candidatus Ordinivivax streblomastigis]